MCNNLVPQAEASAPAGPFTRGQIRWALLGTGLDGMGTGVCNVTIAVLVSQRFGLLAAGVTFAGSATGRALALLLSRRFEGAASRPAALRRGYHLLVAALVLVSLAVCASAALGPLWLTLLLGALATAANGSTSALTISQARHQIMRLGPAGMVGQAFGAGVAGFALSTGGMVGTAAIGAVVVLQALQVPSFDRFGWLPVPAPEARPRALLGPASKVALFAAVSFGPLMLYPALVRQVASARWVGPAMLVYALGSLAAPAVDRHLRRARTWPAVLVLGAAASGSWILAVSGPMVLVARLVSGVLLFTAQGRLWSRITQRHPGPSAISSAALGSSLGAGLGAVLTGALVERVGVQGAGLALALISCVLVIVLSLRRPRLPG